MMTERDLQRVLNDRVADVHLSDSARRNILRASKEVENVHLKKTWIAAVAAAIMLMGTVALAAGVGILHFRGRETLPGAETLVQTDLGRGETEYANYHITEAVYDGRTASILVEITPKDERTLIIPEEFYPVEDLFAYLLPLQHADDEIDLNGPTIAEHAAQNGYERIVTVGTECLANNEGGGKSRWQNNTITMLYQFEATGEAITVDYYYWACENGKSEDQQSVRGSFAMQAKAPLWTKTSAEPITVELGGRTMRIDRVTLTGTELAAYVDIAATDMAGCEIDLLDGSGQLAREGFGFLGTAHHSDDGQSSYQRSMAPSETAPAAVQMQLRLDDKEIVIEVPLV